MEGEEESGDRQEEGRGESGDRQEEWGGRGRVGTDRKSGLVGGEW